MISVDAFDRFAHWVVEHEELELDEIVSAPVAVALFVQFNL